MHLNKREIRNFILELIDTKQKSISQISKESNISKRTIYKWMVYRWIVKHVKKTNLQ
ncbi:helix-turn-helix domain-containing protein [Chryseobacterium sp. RP-3-3]|uniref:Helix-turn-helix domain-containing protein n=1 Tax=Chryseobacterium antibioticum TaxID=2728847 RepID=A0A7Y0AQS5_9FLAO|nr:helix-turn-helix domain-containing protein [Chryseobacterium antibioticum]